jgi:predicted TPR repeat methyltransferase
MFGQDYDDAAYLWFNKLLDDRVNMDITIFSKDKDGKFIRSEENHTEFIHSEKFITDTMQNSGFEVINVSGHLGAQKTEKSERLCYICRKY